MAAADPSGPRFVVPCPQDDPPGLTLPQLQRLTERLKAIAQRNRDSELADLVAQLIIYGAGMAHVLTPDIRSFTLSPQTYASQRGIPIRTVQRWCRTGKLPAVRIDGRVWRIRDERKPPLLDGTEPIHQ
jgi:excisionase family DNA binding protein